MNHLIRHLHGVLIAVAALALSAGLAFGAQPPDGWGLTNAAAHAGKVVPVKAGQLGEDEELDEDTDEDVDEDLDEEEDTDEDVEDDGAGGENCSTDPTALTPEQLAELNHGQIVCWAAHQDEWPEWFTKHGEHVRCWAHSGKADAPSCTEDPNAEEPTTDEAGATSAGNGHGKGQGKGKGHNK